jgi:hypothetical protein
MVEKRNQNPPDTKEIIGEAGSFEITGFRTEKFKDDENCDCSKIETISDSPAIVRAFRLFRESC